MPNAGLGPPQNDEGRFRPVTMGSVPTYWGDDQVLSEDGEWSRPTIQPGVPLHVPRTVRFLYGYEESETPLEADVIKCGCQGKDCTDISCSWEGSKNETINYITNHPYLYYLAGAGLTEASTPVDAGTNDPSFITKVWASWDDFHTNNILYEGPLGSCPYFDKVYSYSVSWNLECVFTGTHGLGNGCVRNFHVNYFAGKEKQSELTCSAIVGTPIGFDITQIGQPGYPGYPGSDSLGNVYLPGQTISDYPPPELYEKACVEGTDPCAGD